MKRMHVGLTVEDVPAAAAFYTRLFGRPPTLEKPDYAKWMLDDPRVNFSIHSRGAAPGEVHLGIQAEDEAELEELRGRWTATGAETLDRNALTCGYQTQDKTWVRDPAGMRWEAFHTYAVTDTFGRTEAEERAGKPHRPAASAIAPSVGKTKSNSGGSSTGAVAPQFPPPDRP